MRYDIPWKGPRYQTGNGGPFRIDEEPEYYLYTTIEDDGMEARINSMVTDSEKVGDLISCHFLSDEATGGEYAELDAIVAKLCANAYSHSQDAAGRRLDAANELYRLMTRAAARKIEKENRP